MGDITTCFDMEIASELFDTLESAAMAMNGAIRNSGLSNELMITKPPTVIDLPAFQDYIKSITDEHLGWISQIRKDLQPFMDNDNTKKGELLAELERIESGYNTQQILVEDNYLNSFPIRVQELLKRYEDYSRVLQAQPIEASKIAMLQERIETLYESHFFKPSLTLTQRSMQLGKYIISLDKYVFVGETLDTWLTEQYASLVGRIEEVEKQVTMLTDKAEVEEAAAYSDWPYEVKILSTLHPLGHATSRIILGSQNSVNFGQMSIQLQVDGQNPRDPLSVEKVGDNNVFEYQFVMYPNNRHPKLVINAPTKYIESQTTKKLNVAKL